ncbi:cytochrome c biogenesis heme-transporting ATPase CcmA [Alginatibacterium sediminis]|uniref:Cytochrome c biogenesis heme-transporting ATPase CcmA n=1 Tax=Alginatibacterium sediminis TaxID=2164068 RepID=A0A420EG08_9ALTE|nr:cytochrome c biogenesis heme-transporting ATPase CcmA [Alginatibacterium sediminis]RKF19506.1 cytochrome c biogenesis heme-transporting ATPase CcmA [Alginatibacterium sediminis]
MSSAVFEAKDLSCVRDERLLFENLSFALSKGEIIQVAGPNGVGKSSLLRILAGLSRAESGQLFWKQSLCRDALDLFNQDTLYLGHHAGVKDELSVAENLRFYQALQSNTNQLSNQKISELLAQVGLDFYEDQLASQLSAGQHRRIALARLWMLNKSLWILDEPFTSIDIAGVEHIQNRMLEHCDNGGMIIVTTHQPLAIPQQRFSVLDISDFQVYADEELFGV